MNKTPAAQRFEEVQVEITRLLKPIGFNKSGRTFYRMTEPGIVHIINLQKPPYPNIFTINLGIFVEFIDDSVHTKREPIKISNIREGQCHIRVRLGALCNRADYWWNLGQNSTEIIADLLPILLKQGLDFLNRFTSREQITDGFIQLSQAKECGVHGPSDTTMAVIFAKNGDTQRAIQSLKTAVARAPDNTQYTKYIQFVGQKLGLNDLAL